MKTMSKLNPILFCLLPLVFIGCDEAEPSVPSHWIPTGNGSNQTAPKNTSLSLLDVPVTAANGQALKLVISERVSTHSSNSGPAIGALNLYDIVYVMQQTTGSEWNFADQWVRVSFSRNGSDSSWIYVTSTNAFPFAHRVFFYPTQMNNSLRVLPVYASFEDCVNAFAGKGVSPIGEFELAKQDRRMAYSPWAILEERKFDGKTAYKVAMVGQTQGTGAQAKPAYTTQEIVTIRRDTRSLCVAVVIDCTGSMQSAMDATKNAIGRFVETISQSQAEARFSLTYFRDLHYDRDWYGHFSLTTATEFNRRLDTLKAAGGGDDPESGYTAMVNFFNDIQWRDRSERIVLIVADAPWHESGKSNPQRHGTRDVIAAAQRANARVFVLGVGDSVALRRQLESVSRETRGSTHTLNNSQALIREITSILRQSASQVDIQARVVDSFLDGKSIEETTRMTGMSEREMTNIIRILDARGFDTERLARGERIGLTGWIVPTVGSITSGTLEVLSFHVEASQVLMFLQGLLENSPDIGFGEKLRDLAGIARSRNESIGDTLIKNGLPHRGSSILSLSPEEIAGLPETERARIHSELRGIIAQLSRELNEDARWIRLPDGRLRGFISESSLP